MSIKRTQKITSRQATLAKSRRTRATATGVASGLTAQSVASWLTLQKITLAQPGVCTEQEMFYRHDGEIFVSALNGQILMEPGAAVRFSTAFNLLSLEALDRTCRLGRLAFALRGVGRVEVLVSQGLAGRSGQQLLSDIVTLNPAREVVIDLEAGGLDRREGALWIELRAVGGEEGARLDSGRFLTDCVPDAGLRLAICFASAKDEERTDHKLDHVLGWAVEQSDRVSVFSCSPTAKSAPGLIVLPEQDTRQAALAAMLTEAKTRAFTHVLMISADTTIGLETLDRTLACLSILRDPPTAIGAGSLDVADASRLDNNGLVRNAEGRLSPLTAQSDISELSNALDAGFDAVSGAGSALIVPQSTFLAFALSSLGNDPAAALTHDRFGFEDLTCVNEGALPVHQLPGLLIRRDTFGRKITGLMTLQNLIFPEQGICTETNMYFHADEGVVFDECSASITVESGGTAFFDTYFNAFSIGKWHQDCALNGLWLGITGRGRAEIKVFHAIPERSWEVLATTVVNLSKVNPSLVNLSHYAENATRGVIFFEVRALSTGVAITGARFLTEAEPDPRHRLALSITTFKREAQVENTARRLALYFERAEFAAHMDCFIVDNGNSANIIAHPKIRRIANANLGGAGGFTRGLLEAEAAGYSHVLFMDDDASIPMEALHRTFAFLTLARDPKAAVAGAMINSTDKWRMWENGATFDRRCYPLFSGTDLRERNAVFQMENESAISRSSKMYGGWWFFAFPVAQVTHHPFPFFVRGDDVNFSLGNDFAITTLNGVVSFAEDFTDKESPLTWYLDLRSHMVHHLTLDKMEVGRFKLARIGLAFVGRNMAKFQYETIEAVLKAWEDVLKGPDFFTGNADASAQRAAIKALTRQEAWKPAADLNLKPKAGFLEGQMRLRRMFYPLSLNGHFLPFYSLWGSKRVIPAAQRGHLDAMWGASQLTFLNSARDKGYVTKRSNLKALKLMVRMTGLWLRTVLGYDALRALYHKRYPQITTPDYWRGALSMQPADAKAVPPKVAPVETDPAKVA
ncbi:MAG: glycosyltransferase family 2 protein [Cypionkella sp.]